MGPSLMLQILFYLTSFYFGMFVLLEFGALLFKGLHLPYPGGGLWVDAVMLIMLGLTEGFRIAEGQKGNLTSARGKTSLVISMGMCAPSVLAVLYVMAWQHYVLRIEVVLCSIQICLQVTEFFVSFSVLSDSHIPPSK